MDSEGEAQLAVYDGDELLLEEVPLRFYVLESNRDYAEWDTITKAWNRTAKPQFRTDTGVKLLGIGHYDVVSGPTSINFYEQGDDFELSDAATFMILGNNIDAIFP